MAIGFKLVWGWYNCKASLILIEKLSLAIKGHNIRSLILNHSTAAGNQIFLSVSKKFNSACWQVTYILQEDSLAREFVQCPAAYLAADASTKKSAEILKHTPSVVEEVGAC